MPRWYVSIDSKASGPFETADVIESIRQRKYVLVDLVFQEGGSLWKSFDEVGEFKIIFDELKTADESRSKVDSYLNHPWVILRKTKDFGPDKYLQEGPYSSDEVLKQIADGKLDYTDYIWKKGFDKWIRIGFIPEFDRMRNLSENSFVDQNVPLPEIQDSNDRTLKVSSEEILKSVQVLKKDQTYYQNETEDPDYVEPLIEPAKSSSAKPSADINGASEAHPPNNRDIDLSAIVLLDDSETPPPENLKKPEAPKAAAGTPSEINFSQDSLRNIFSGDFQSPNKPLHSEESARDKTEPKDLVKKDGKVDLKTDKIQQAARREELEKLEEATQVIRRPEKKIEPPIFDKKIERHATEKNPLEKGFIEKTGETKISSKKDKAEKSSFFSSFKKLKKTAKETSNESQDSETAQTAKVDRANESHQELRSERRKGRRPTSPAMMLFSIFAILALLLTGLFTYRNALLGENSAIEKLTQKLFPKSSNEQLSEGKIPNPPVALPPQTPPPTQAQETAAQDPNLKVKIENQLESGANQKLPDTGVPQPPANTQADAQRGILQKASFVDIDLRGFSRNSKATLLTNGPIGTVILVYISARTGDILTFPSFYKEYKIVRRSNRGIELDLTGLSPGRYNIEAEIGDLKKLRVLSVKEEDFNRKIEAHLKQVSYEQQKEKKALFYGAKSLETLLKRLFESARLAQSQNRDWNGFYMGFRQSIKSSLSALVTSLNDSNRNNYAYPDELFDLIDLKDNLLKNAEDLDRSIKTRKPIEGKIEQDLYKEFEKIRKRAAILSVRKVLN